MLEPIREVLSFLFNDVLAPVIGIFIQWQVNFLMYLLRIVFQELLVRAMVLLCRVVFFCEDLNSKCFVDFLLGLLRHRINDLVLTDLLFDLGLSRIDGLLRSLLYLLISLYRIKKFGYIRHSIPPFVRVAKCALHFSRTDPALLSLFYQCAAVFSIKNEEEYTDLNHRLRGI